MAVPTRAEALALLLSTSPSSGLLQHMTVVAEVASFLAYRIGQNGVAVDRRLVETAALLHDVDKALPRDHPLRAHPHGEAGAIWISEAGHPELARAIRAHTVMRLDEPDAADWVVDAPLEERVVAYADKRATQRVVSLTQRFERWTRKHPAYARRLARAEAHARRLEEGICLAAGITPDAVERLRWVDDAIARCRAAGTLPPEEANLSADPSAAA